MLLKSICSSALFYCIAFIILDCSVLAMQSNWNPNAAPFIPQQQQQQRRQLEYEQANLHGAHQQHQQIQPVSQNVELNLPSDLYPLQTHSPNLSPSPVMSPVIPFHYNSNVREEQFQHEEEPYEFDDLMKHVVDFAVGSEEKGASSSSHIGQENWRSLNPYASDQPLQHLTPLLQTIPQGTSLFSDSTSITGRSNPVPVPKLSSPTKAISQTTTGVSHIVEPSRLKEANTEKITFGTVDDDMLKPKTERPKSRGPPSGLPETNPPITESAKPKIAAASTVKETPKYLEVVKKSPPSTSTNNSPPRETQIKPKSPNSIEGSKSDMAEVGEAKNIPSASTSIIGQDEEFPALIRDDVLKFTAGHKPDEPKHKTVETGPSAINLSKSEQKLLANKKPPESFAIVSLAIPEITSPGGNKDAAFKQKGTKKNRGGKRRGNYNYQSQGSSAGKINPENVGAKNEVIAKPPEMARKSKSKKKAKEIFDDKEWEESVAVVNEIKPETKNDGGEDNVLEHHSSDSDDYFDAQDMGLEEEAFDTAPPCNEGKEIKKKSVKQLKREKEMADEEAIKESAEKRKKELEEEKDKAKAVIQQVEELNKELKEKMAKIKNKLATQEISEHSSSHQTSSQQQNTSLDSIRTKAKEYLKQLPHDIGEKNKASNSETSSIQVSEQTSSQQYTHTMRLDSIEIAKVEKPPIDHHNEIKTLLSILKYEEIMRIAKNHDSNEELLRKDIRYLLVVIQLFYEAFYKYWDKSYKFHDKLEYAYISEVLAKIGKFYTNNGKIEENVKLFEKTEESLKKSVHILAEIWTVPKYREIMLAESFNKFINWMEALEQILKALKLFDKKIKRFNRDARKKGTLEKLQSNFKTNVHSYFVTMLNLNFHSIFGIISIGMDKQDLDKLVSRKNVLTGLNYLKSWLPGRKSALVYARKVMWRYFEIENYLFQRGIREHMGAFFEKIFGFPMPERNYIEIGSHAHDTVYLALNMLDDIHKYGNNHYNASPGVKKVLDVYKEHILCANFLVEMYKKIYKSYPDFINKHNVHLHVDERNFWKIVDEDKCIPAEEKFNKISIMPGYQDFLQGHGMLKKIIDDALEELDNLKLKYEIEERRKEARGECDCCKPEEGYERDSEEEKGQMKMEKMQKGKEKLEGEV